MAFLRLGDKLTVHFSFNKFTGTAPDFRKYRGPKNVVIYCVSASTCLDSMDLGYKFNLKLHNFSYFHKVRGNHCKEYRSKMAPLLTGYMNLEMLSL